MRSHAAHSASHLPALFLAQDQYAILALLCVPQDDGIVVGMGGRVMSQRPSVFGLLPGDGDILTTSEYLQTAETLRVQVLPFFGISPEVLTGW